MIEFLLTMVVLAIVGLVVGIGVLITQENPKVAEFFTKRPVVAYPAAFVAVGLAVYAILYVLMIIALAVVG
jgi:hypothetical protein